MSMPARNEPIKDGVPATRAGRREWIGLAVLALPCVLYSMDLTVLKLAAPGLRADLMPSGTHSSVSGRSVGVPADGTRRDH